MGSVRHKCMSIVAACAPTHHHARACTFACMRENLQLCFDRCSHAHLCVLQHFRHGSQQNAERDSGARQGAEATAVQRQFLRLLRAFTNAIFAEA